MIKYLHIPVDGADPIQVPIGEGIFVERKSATVMKLYWTTSLDHHVELTTVGSTAAMVKAIEDALVEGSVKNWTDAVVPVKLPDGETVTSATVTTGP